MDAMRRIFGIAAAMVLSVAIGFAALGVGFYCLNLARAEEAVAASDFTLADGIYARLERSLEKGKYIPGIPDKARTDLTVRRSLMAYRLRDYAAVLDATETGDENAKRLDPALRFIRANARFRMASGEQSREKVLRALGQSIKDYATVLGDDPAFTDAAFNYEYLVMLRNDMAVDRRSFHLQPKGTRNSRPDEEDLFGPQGAEAQARGEKRMKVLVPREGDEDPEKKGQEPSKGSAKKKFG
jgi:hypothetical protein